jgi:hypothetical protein
MSSSEVHQRVFAASMAARGPMWVSQLPGRLGVCLFGPVQRGRRSSTAHRWRLTASVGTRFRLPRQFGRSGLPRLAHDRARPCRPHTDALDFERNPRTTIDTPPSRPPRSPASRCNRRASRPATDGCRRYTHQAPADRRTTFEFQEPCHLARFVFGESSRGRGSCDACESEWVCLVGGGLLCGVGGWGSFVH